MNRYKPIGWRNDSYRHSLAAKGIKTRQSMVGKEIPIHMLRSNERKDRLWKDVVSILDKDISVSNKTDEIVKRFEEEKKADKLVDEITYVDKKSMAGKQRYVVKKVGDNFMIVDNDVGEFLIGYSFKTNEKAEDFIKENLKKNSEPFGYGKDEGVIQDEDSGTWMSLAGKKYSMALRKLDNDEIERLANKPGVKKIAVENFLMTVDNNDNAMYAGMNLGEDAKSYKWNAATVSAIKEGIRLADRSK